LHPSEQYRAVTLADLNSFPQTSHVDVVK